MEFNSTNRVFIVPRPEFVSDIGSSGTLDGLGYIFHCKIGGYEIRYIDNNESVPEHKELGDVEELVNQYKGFYTTIERYIKVNAIEEIIFGRVHGRSFCKVKIKTGISLLKCNITTQHLMSKISGLTFKESPEGYDKLPKVFENMAHILDIFMPEEKEDGSEE